MGWWGCGENCNLHALCGDVRWCIRRECLEVLRKVKQRIITHLSTSPERLWKHTCTQQVVQACSLWHYSESLKSGYLPEVHLRCRDSFSVEQQWIDSGQQNKALIYATTGMSPGNTLNERNSHKGPHIGWFHYIKMSRTSNMITVHLYGGHRLVAIRAGGWLAVQGFCCCSCRGPRLSSLWVRRLVYLHFRGIWCPLLASTPGTHAVDIHACRQTLRHVKFKNFQRITVATRWTAIGEQEVLDVWSACCFQSLGLLTEISFLFWGMGESGCFSFHSDFYLVTYWWSDPQS